MKKTEAVFVKSFPESFNCGTMPITAAYWTQRKSLATSRIISPIAIGTHVEQDFVNELHSVAAEHNGHDSPIDLSAQGLQADDVGIVFGSAASMLQIRICFIEIIGRGRGIQAWRWMGNDVSFCLVRSHRSFRRSDGTFQTGSSARDKTWIEISISGSV